MAHKTLGANTPVPKLRRDSNTGFASRFGGIPIRQRVFLPNRVGANIGDFNADASAVGDGRVPGALLKIQSLVQGSIQIQHEMHAEIAMIMKNVEALPAGAAGIEVNYKLVHSSLQERQIPSAPTHQFEFVWA